MSVRGEMEEGDGGGEVVCEGFGPEVVLEGEAARGAVGAVEGVVVDGHVVRTSGNWGFTVAV